MLLSYLGELDTRNNISIDVPVIMLIFFDEKTNIADTVRSETEVLKMGKIQQNIAQFLALGSTTAFVKI